MYMIMMYKHMFMSIYLQKYVHIIIYVYTSKRNMSAACRVNWISICKRNLKISFTATPIYLHQGTTGVPVLAQRRFTLKPAPPGSSSATIWMGTEHKVSSWVRTKLPSIQLMNLRAWYLVKFHCSSTTPRSPASQRPYSKRSKPA